MTNQNLREAAYLIDRTAFLHVKETPEGDFSYAAFDRDSKAQIAAGKIEAEAVRELTDATHSPVTAARILATRDAGLYGFESSRVGLTALLRVLHI